MSEPIALVGETIDLKTKQKQNFISESGIPLSKDFIHRTISQTIEDQKTIGQTVMWLAPIFAEDDINHQEAETAEELFDKLHLDIIDCVYMDPRFFFGNGEEYQTNKECQLNDLANLIWNCAPYSGLVFAPKGNPPVGIINYCPGEVDIIELHFAPLPSKSGAYTDDNKIFRIALGAAMLTGDNSVPLLHLKAFLQLEYGKDFIIYKRRSS